MHFLHPLSLLWKTIAPNLLLHNSKSISNFYYFPQSNSLYFSAFRSVSFLRGFRGDSQCNDISIQFRPLPPPVVRPSLSADRHMRFSQTNRHFTIFFLFESLCCFISANQFLNITCLLKNSSLNIDKVLG